MKEKKVYTIDDVARALGVSKTTVSRAISGKGRLSDQTRKRVLDFIAEHNFRPNAVARSLAYSRTFNLGLLLPVSVGGIDGVFFRECMLGISQVASEHDYDVLVAMDDEHSTHQMRRILDNQKVDGVIVARSKVESQVISLLQERHVPSVVMGDAPDPQMICVDNSNREACRDLTALLIGRGIRRMALLAGDENYAVTRSRLQGFREACLQAGLPWEEQLVFPEAVNSARVSAAVRQCVERRVECVLCMDDFICNLTLPQLREQGVAVPGQMKVACFYDNSLLENLIPSVTSLRFDAVELGRVACRTLLELLKTGQAQSTVLPGYQVILRDSTK